MCIYASIHIHVFVVGYCVDGAAAHEMGIGKCLVVSLTTPIRRQRELPRTSEVCPYLMKDLILRTSEVVCPRG